jgi:glutamate racemase
VNPHRPEALVVDWGIGGFGVLREIVRLRPETSLTYLSDSGSVPYGKLPTKELGARLTRIFAWAKARGLSLVVVACNAASSALHLAKVPVGLTVVDVIDAGVELVRESGVASVGLVGGRGTLRTGAHRKRLAGVYVRARVAQPLSALVEAGELDTPRVHREVQAIVSPLRSLDTVLLACTHYPALLPVFREVLPHATFLDPATRVAERVVASLPKRRGASRSSPTLEVLTTGDASATRKAAARAFGVETGRVVKLPLDLDLGLELEPSASARASVARISRVPRGRARRIESKPR